MLDGRPTPARSKPWRLRAWLRALHRDLGYLAVGLTFVYAVSGLAVNHLASWDPNFVNFERELHVATPLPAGDDAAAAFVLEAIGREERPTDVYRSSPSELEITLEHSTLFVALETGRVYEEGQRPRPLLRVMNWLHLNRGKQAWTYFADAYAVALVVLASTGIFMLPGKKGLLGRGGLLVSLGIAAPLAYLAYFGSP